MWFASSIIVFLLLLLAACLLKILSHLPVFTAHTYAACVSSVLVHVLEHVNVSEDAYFSIYVQHCIGLHYLASC